MSTFDKLAGLIERVTGTPASNISMATTIGDVTDDDFERYEIYLEIESDFGIVLDDADLEFIGTVGEFAGKIDVKLQRQARAA